MMWEIMNRVLFNIYEWVSEGVKEGNLLEFTYNIKCGDKPWTEVSSIERKCDGIKVDNYDEKTVRFTVGTSGSE